MATNAVIARNMSQAAFNEASQFPTLQRIISFGIGLPYTAPELLQLTQQLYSEMVNYPAFLRIVAASGNTTLQKKFLPAARQEMSNLPKTVALYEYLLFSAA